VNVEKTKSMITSFENGFIYKTEAPRILYIFQSLIIRIYISIKQRNSKQLEQFKKDHETMVPQNLEVNTHVKVVIIFIDIYYPLRTALRK
jgi:hypothetical protein